MPLTAPALAAFGTQIYLGTDASPAVFSTPVARVGDIAVNGLSVMMQDVSNQSSSWKRTVGTLHDGGTFTFTLYFYPTLDQVMLIVFGTVPPPIRSFMLTFPDNDQWFFNGTISKWATKAPVEGVITADVEITIDGQVIL